jgi:type I restriction enzyme S subunit
VNGLPKGWRTAKLGRVLELQYGKSLPEKSRRPGRVRVFGSNGPIGVHHEPLTSGTTIIVGRKGSIGEVHLSYEPCFPIDTTYYVDSFDFVTPEFAAGLLRSLGLQNMDRASAIPGLNRNEVYELDVQIPPLPDQRRIVAKLDSLTGPTARAREELGRIPRLIQKYREAILAAAFSGELTREWRHVNGLKVPPLSSLGGLVSDIRYGTSKKCHAGGNGIAVLRIPNVLAGKIDLSDLKYASLEPKELNKLRLQDGDVLIVRSNGSPDLVGRPALVERSAVGLAFAGYLIRLRPKPNAVEPQFLAMMLQSSQIRKVIDITARSTSGVHNINSAELGALAIPCPELVEQQEIVRRIETAFAWLDRVAAEHADASRLLPKLDQAILAKAFRGELCSQIE